MPFSAKNRIIPLFLAISLAFDPATAAGLSLRQQPLRPSAYSEAFNGLFQSEALSPVARWAHLVLWRSHDLFRNSARIQDLRLRLPSSQATAELRRAVRKTAKILPLEFVGVPPRSVTHLTADDWPSVQSALRRDVDPQAALLIILPSLVASLLPEGNAELRQATAYAYAAAIYQRLSTTDKQRLRRLVELQSFSGWLRRIQSLSVLDMPALSEAIAAMVGIPAEQQAAFSARLASVLERRDQTIARARALRIGADILTQKGYGRQLERFRMQLTKRPELQAFIAGEQSALVLAPEALTAEEVQDLESLFYVMRQVSGSVLRVMPLADGRWYLYDFYALERQASLHLPEQVSRFTATEEGFDHLIRMDFAGLDSEARGLFRELAQRHPAAGNDRGFDGARLFGAVLEAARHDPLARWDADKKFYRAEALASRILEVTPISVRDGFMATIERPLALRHGLESELENHRLFNRRLDRLTILDDSAEPTLTTNRATVKEMAERYDIPIRHLTSADRRHLEEVYAAFLVARWQDHLDRRDLDRDVRQVLDEHHLIREGRLDVESVAEHLRATAFNHISGVRNQTMLLMMNRSFLHFDDDAPPETYVLTPSRLAAVRSRRQSRRNLQMAKFRNAVAARLYEPIADDAALYRALAENRRRLSSLADTYFAFSPTEKQLGLVPRAVDEIVSMDDAELENDLSQYRYRSLMTLPEEAAQISDMQFVEGRRVKTMPGAEEAYWVLPVDTLGASRVLGKAVSDVSLPSRTDDLRGVRGRPTTREEKAEMKGWRIAYLVFPFIFDQDTPALKQLVEYVRRQGGRGLAQLQHTNRMALVGEGILGFVGHKKTHGVFNRAIIEAQPFPSVTIGAELRTEEQPAFPWVWRLVRRIVALAYAPVGGGQQRYIDERLYHINKQDSTELKGGFSRRWYEDAGGHLVGRTGQLPDTEPARLHELGKTYVALSRGLALSADKRDEALRERERRALLISELALLIPSTESPIEQVDMATVMLRYADSFNLYHPRDAARRDYAPKGLGDYFYEIETIDLGEGRMTVTWRAAVPKVVGGTDLRRYEEISWDVGDHRGFIITSQHASDQPIRLELEPGRWIILPWMPRPGEKTIVPALVTRYETAFLKDIETTLETKLRSDGETFLLWKDLVAAEEARIQESTDLSGYVPVDIAKHATPWKTAAASLLFGRIGGPWTHSISAVTELAMYDVAEGIRNLILAGAPKRWLVIVLNIFERTRLWALQITYPGLAAVFARIDDWVAFSAFQEIKDKINFRTLVLAIARFSPRAAALFFAAQGAHLRREFREPDNAQDLPLHRELMEGFLPHLAGLLRRTDSAAQKGIVEYGTALFGGLMILPFLEGESSGQDGFARYQVYFTSWTRELAAKGIDLPGILEKVKERMGETLLPPEQIPETLSWTGAVLAFKDIFKLFAYNHDHEVALSAWQIFTGHPAGRDFRTRVAPDGEDTSYASGDPAAMLKIYQFLLAQGAAESAAAASLGRIVKNPDHLTEFTVWRQIVYWIRPRLLGLADSKILDDAARLVDCLLNPLAALSPALAACLTTIDDWIASAAFGGIANAVHYKTIVLAIARYSPRAAALLFAAMGPHVRNDLRPTDVEQDLSRYPELLKGFLPRLRDLLDRNNARNNKEIERYGMALLGGLMFLPYITTEDALGKVDGLTRYQRHFAFLTAALAEEGIDLPGVLHDVALHLRRRSLLPREQIPENLMWAGQDMASTEIEDLIRYNNENTLRLSAWDVFTGHPNAKAFRARLTGKHPIPPYVNRDLPAMYQIYLFLIDQQPTLDDLLPHERQVHSAA